MKIKRRAKLQRGLAYSRLVGRASMALMLKYNTFRLCAMSCVGSEGGREDHRHSTLAASRKYSDLIALGSRLPALQLLFFFHLKFVSLCGVSTRRCRGLTASEERRGRGVGKPMPPCNRAPSLS